MVPTGMAFCLTIAAGDFCCAIVKNFLSFNFFNNLKI